MNLDAGALGYRPIDLPPFSGLDGAVSVASLFMVVLILATQRREDQLAQLREQLNLECDLERAEDGEGDRAARRVPPR